MVEKRESFIIDIEDLDPSTKLFRIEAKDFTFKSGQFVILSLVDGKEIRRSYSMASSPYDSDYLEFCIRLKQDGEFTPRLFNLDIGDKISFEGPYGNFLLKEHEEKILIAGGTGIAPIRSMLRTLNEEKKLEKNIWLFFGFNKTGEFLFRKELEGYKKSGLNLVPVVLHPESHWKGELGYVMPAIKKFIPKGDEKDVYICGPPLMVRAVVQFLLEHGFSKERIYRDEW